MAVEVFYRWHRDSLVAVAAPKAHPGSGSSASPLRAADSWLVDGGKTLALPLHRARFLDAVDAGGADVADAARFWEAAIALVPHTGAWFPRVELDRDQPVLSLRLREAPERTESVVVATLDGDDPRTIPGTKGPDLERMYIARKSVAPLGAGEAVLLTSPGFVVEGAYSGLLWWRGEILCGPPMAFDRVDSVTVRSVLALAIALGIETFEEPVTPAELDGTELWALSALHGPRIVTAWIDGPGLAELPGRLGTWRARLAALRQPLPG